MKVSIVSLEEARSHLRILGNDDDATILHLIKVSEEELQGFVGTITETADEVPAILKQALLCFIEADFSGNPLARERALQLLSPRRQWAF